MIFLVVIIGLVLYYIVPKTSQSVILTFLSLYIYWVLDPSNILTILVIVLLVSVCGTVLAKTSSKPLLILSLSALALPFLIFRNKFVNINLPMGYSVVAFTSVCLLVQRYRCNKTVRFFETMSFLLFFPKIFAGPIMRPKEFIGSHKKIFKASNLYQGFRYLVFASFCKYIVGDIIAATEMSEVGINQLFNVLIFSIGFFFDFWSYTMMAIGVGLLFGFHLPVSFNSPYYAKSLKDFWHRWNMTLGTWLRDYIYIPLGGKKNSNARWIVVVFIVFIISGLWHGITFPFLLWGILHAVFFCIEHYLIRPWKLNKWLSYAYTLLIFIFVSLLWQLFVLNSSTEIIHFLKSFGVSGNLNITILFKLLMSTLATIGLTSASVLNLVFNKKDSYLRIVGEVGILSSMIILLVILNCNPSINFFYFRF